MRFAPLLLAVALLAGCLQSGGHTEPPGSTLTAARIIWSHPYPDLLIEIDYVEGHTLLPSTVTHLASTLRNLTDKRDLRLIETALPDDPRFHQEDYVWSKEELVNLSETTFNGGRLRRGGEGTYAFLHVMVLNGYGDRDGESFLGLFGKLGGFASGPSLFVFPTSMNSYEDTVAWPPLAGEKPSYDKVERWLVTHELGHVLGLVNGEVPMLHPRQAEDGTRHSTSPSSPMYMTDESNFAPFEDATGRDYTPDQFDQYDLEDLAAFRERGRQLAPPGAYKSW